MRPSPLLLCLALAAGTLVAAPAIAQPAPAALTAPGDAAPAEPTLERIMADPDWLGNPPEDPYWADDEQSVYYAQKRPGEEAHDLVQVDLAGEVVRRYGVGETGQAESPGLLSPDGRRKVWTRDGDLFVKDLESGAVHQLTRTAAAESDPRFTADGQGVIFRRDNAVFIRDLASGLESQAAELRLTKDPDAPPEKQTYLERQQLRLFDVLREKKQKEEEARERERADRAADPTRVGPPFYLGDKVEIRQASLSPAGRWMVVVLGKKDEDRGPKSLLPRWVTKSGNVETEEIRPKVGTGKRTGERLLLLDLETHESHPLPTDALPGIFDDPLAALRARAKAAEKRRRQEAEKAGAAGPALEVEDLEPRRAEEGEAGGEEAAAQAAAETQRGDGEGPGEGEETAGKKPRPRPVEFAPLVWSDDGRRVAIRTLSLDNKDRWIATVDFAAKALVPVHRLHDPAWVGWDLNELGWLAGGDRLWYLSEESGFSQLYVADLATETPAPAPEPPAAPEAAAPVATGEEEAAAETPAPIDDRVPPVSGEAFAGVHRRLTDGELVVSQVQASRDGAWLYYQANAGAPGTYEIWRVAVGSGENEQVTALGGINTALLSPAEDRLLITHSTTTRPPELYVQGAAPGAAATPVTHTVSPEFEAIDWAAPEIVAVPASHAPRPIYARLFLPPGAADAPPASLPAVFFVHGAGYLQEAHAGWSDYFHEFMFHTLLVRRGYAVLDMDYRGSAGYGRDWRTAIYRHMGAPELEDLADGIAWLTARYPVDPQRIGVYGGSYGGFLTLMALFTRPELFACGAALRPVTDWAHYNHPYTSNILNTPDLDPEAYERSSPIEFADGLRRPLLICSPMVDDNVLFQDDVRLAQRLIELGKEDWQVAIFPVEPHGFRQPSSWLDEYRRIFKLFEENLEPRPGATR
jgi:dipeptidyl aminopeptidase/acylaminoacyl peptidase